MEHGENLTAQNPERMVMIDERVTIRQSVHDALPRLLSTSYTSRYPSTNSQVFHTSWVSVLRLRPQVSPDPTIGEQYRLACSLQRWPCPILSLLFMAMAVIPGLWYSLLCLSIASNRFQRASGQSRFRCVS
ncbi:hypothetical protein CC80DRAFT_147317 [Byssothecium circinans]|uniref:Uncharacterized protein n=1 Tax=Byssothecium circinans TaxID=147558 RepID=A0A6A5TKE5_9PLEO|nr:hypothetical protein CC80DRAFT_147317 [Byssothecium circinans]